MVLAAIDRSHYEYYLNSIILMEIAMQTITKDEARKSATKARRKALNAVRRLETALEEVDDYGARGASGTVSDARKELREAAELLADWPRDWEQYT